MKPLFYSLFLHARRLLLASLSRERRRVRVVLGILILLSCAATVRHVDEAQVRSIAAKRMDCDEQLVEAFAQPSGTEGIAYYEIHACNKIASYTCTEQNHIVDCDDSAKATTSSDSTPSDYDPSGCNCGNLFASHHSSPASSPAQPSVMPTQPQGDRHQR